MTTQEETSELSNLEEEALDLLRKGGFFVADGATRRIFKGFPMKNPVLVSHLMGLVVFLVRMRKAYLTESPDLKKEKEEVEDHELVLEKLGVSEERLFSLVREIGRLTPREALRGEKGKP